MKKLEEKIINAVAKNASSGILSISQSVLKAIEPNVKDIAIEFNIFRLKSEIELELKRISGEITEDEFIEIQMAELNKSADTYWNELFDQFIKEKYGTP